MFDLNFPITYLVIKALEKRLTIKKFRILNNKKIRQT